jgi:hypothetical protein
MQAVPQQQQQQQYVTRPTLAREVGSTRIRVARLLDLCRPFQFEFHLFAGMKEQHEWFSLSEDGI